MKLFVKKISFFFIPLILLVSLYFYLDPFMVIKNYDSYYDSNVTSRVGLNVDYVSTTTFDKNYSKEKYDSFIFGNSRSIIYEIAEWKKYIGKNSKCYHFDASGEALYSLHKKIQYLQNNKVHIKNALLVIDIDLLHQALPRSGHLGIISPQLINNDNFLDFHKTFLKAFFNPKFMYAYFDFKITNKVKPYMKKEKLIDNTPYNYDKLTNEIKFDYFEELIQKEKFYTEEKMNVFYERDSVAHSSKVYIKKAQKEILEDIKRIFLENKTNVKIIISPLYNQQKIALEDFNYLKATFGDNTIFDYSGINHFTNDYRNYYENEHYRPTVAAEILKDIYSINIH